MTKFVTPLQLEPMLGTDGKPLLTPCGRRLFRLLSDFIYHSDQAGEIVVKAGFITDLGSVPRVPIVYELLGELAIEPYVIHDLLYSTGQTARKTADRILLEALLFCDVEQDKAEAIYWGVRAAGAHYYNYGAR